MKKAVVILPFVLLLLTIAAWVALERATNPKIEPVAITGPAGEEPAPISGSGSPLEAEESLTGGESVGQDSAATAKVAGTSVPTPRWRESAANQRDRTKSATTSGSPRSSPDSGTSGSSRSRGSGPDTKRDQPDTAARTTRSPESSRGPASTPPTTRPVPGATRNDGSDRSRAKPEDTPEDRVDDPTSDTEAPTLVSIEFIPGQIQDGESISVIVMATDDLSGVKFVSGSVRSPNAGAVIGFSAQADPTGERFVGAIRVPEKADAGEWHVNQLRMMDQANNTRAMSWNGSTAPPNARFRVVSANADSDPPTVRSILLDRESVNPGETNVVRVAVEDDKSGVAAVYGMFSSPSGRATASFHCTLDPGSGIWVGNLPLPADADCGEWSLRNLSVSDNANNRDTLGADKPLIAATKFFLSFEGNCDSEPPNVTLVQFDPTAVINTEPSIVRVIVMIEDDSTGVKHVSGRLVGPAGGDGQPPMINFGLKPSADPRRWEGTFTVPALAAKGFWSLQSLQALDNANNRRNYSQNDRVLQGVGVTVQ